MTVAALNEQFGVPNQIRFLAGPNNIPLLQIVNNSADATISLLGGQVLNFKSGPLPTLWLSELAMYEVGKAIRGGVPVIWPWFGSHPGDASKNSHGFARHMIWQVGAAAALADGSIQVDLVLEDDEATRAAWPHRFRLEQSITLGASSPAQLAIDLTIHNLGEDAFHWSGALHSYFTVGNIAKTEVTNLDGVPYQDKVHGCDKVQTGNVTFSEEVDRVYLTPTPQTDILDNALKRRHAIHHNNADSVIVWNPGVTAKKADLTEGAYGQFVCVETAVGAGATSETEMPFLEGGQSFSFGTTIQTTSL